MSRKHTYIFICLCLFPFVLAMGFRAADNYQFAQHREMLHKESPSYFPKEPPRSTDWLIEKKFTCDKKEKLSLNDSTDHSPEYGLMGMD